MCVYEPYMNFPLFFFLVSIASSIAAGFLLPSSHVCVSRLASPRPFSLQSHASLQLCAVHTCGAVDQGFTWRLGALDQYRSFNGFRAYVSFVHMYCKELWTRHYWPNTCDIIQHFVVMNCGEYSCCMQFCRNDSYLPTPVNYNPLYCDLDSSKEFAYDRLPYF